MKIRLTIKLKLLLLALFILASMITLLITTVLMIEQPIIKTGTANSQDAASEIAKNIKHAIELVDKRLQVVTMTPFIMAQIEKSNAIFSSMPHRDAVVATQNSNWANLKKDESNALVQEISSNDASLYLRKLFVEINLETKGYAPFSEILITNKYGVNIAQTRKTKRYNQQDEIWWQMSKKNGQYQGAMEFDKSSNAYIMPIAFALYNKKHDFIGVTKGTLSVLDIINESNIFFKIIGDRELMVFDDNFKKIYSRHGFQSPEVAGDVLLKENIKKGIYIFRNPQNNKEVFVKKINVFRFKWYLVVEYSPESVTKPFFVMLTVSMGLIILISLGMVAIISRSLTGQIKRLKEYTVKLDELEEIEVIGSNKSNDEIGQFATEFIATAAKVTKHYKDISLALKKTSAEAKRANVAKSEFLASMSHELRTPMNSILGISAMLIKYDTKNLTEEQLEGLTLINSSGNRLLALINDILDLAKIESGKLKITLTSVNLDNFLLDIDKTVKNLITADEKKNDMVFLMEKEASVSKLIQTDDKLLRQILMNILANAVKFTAKGRITLTVSVKEQKLYFNITDTGIGIKKKHMKRLFEKFSQVDTALNRQFQGTGLGLNITKNLVTLLQGEINIESQYDVGSTVTFWIPYKSINIEKRLCHVKVSKESDAMALEDNKQSKILIIENSKDTKYLYSEYLKSKDYIVFCASNGLEGLEKIIELKPRMVILDLKLPKMSGEELSIKLKEIDAVKNIPLIVMTKLDYKEAYEKYHFFQFISKPVSETTFINAIDACETFIQGREEQILGLSNRALITAEDTGGNAYVNETREGEEKNQTEEKNKITEINNEKKVTVTNKTILIVEDDHSSVVTIKMMLKKRYNLIFAKNGFEVLRLCDKRAFDIILLDIMMPKMDGFETFRQLKKRNFNAPVIAVTALAMIGDVEKIKSAGFDGYVSKPIDEVTLIHEIEKFVKRGKYE